MGPTSGPPPLLFFAEAKKRPGWLGCPDSVSKGQPPATPNGRAHRLRRLWRKKRPASPCGVRRGPEGGLGPEGPREAACLGLFFLHRRKK